MSGPILAIDTATTRVVIAVGAADGAADAATSWTAGYRHGETLLPSIDTFLAERGTRLTELAAIVVGTGPGAFTGLRVGMATAKGLTHGLGIPLVGVSTAEALLGAADATPAILLLPAGPSDRVVVRPGEAPRLLPGGTEPDALDGEVLVAVDLTDRAPADALERGERAREALGPTLLRLGAERLAALPDGELATVVPEYVTLPRGAQPGAGSVEWSRDPR